MTTTKVTRPALRYHGGKWKLAPWITSFFPAHKIYTEVYGGAASVLLRKPRSYAEVYNELDGEITNLFRVIRDDGMTLVKLLKLTPFSHEEFDLSYIPCEDPVEQARRTVIRSFMGHGSAAASGQTTGFRASSSRSGTAPSRDWMTFPASLERIVQRMQGVTIENKDAFEILCQHDRPDSLHYVDPPYVHSTRGKNAKYKSYKHEMTEDDHIQLAKILRSLKGTVVLSGYSSKLYEDLFPNWHSTSKEALAENAGERIEVLWFNRQLKSQLELF